MLNWIRKQLQKEEGLTLIELIVVVAIIAILAFTITPRVLDALNNSKLSSARSVANELHSAMERFYANAGVAGTDTYPVLLTGAPATNNFSNLRTVLGDTLGMTTNTDSVFTAGTFNYRPYDQEAPVAADLIAAGAGTRALWYCVQFTARDRDTTDFLVSPTGVTENPAGAVVTAQCP